jgi:hypothetical protein
MSMHTHLQIGGYEIEFDRDATAACYSRLRVPGPEACGCAQCRNWFIGRDSILTAEFRCLLSQFGIPTDGEIEVWECPGHSQPHLYFGWYFIIGLILSGAQGYTFELAVSSFPSSRNSPSLCPSSRDSRFKSCTSAQRLPSFCRRLSMQNHQIQRFKVRLERPNHAL